MMSPSVLVEYLTYIILFIGGIWFTTDIIKTFNSARSSFIETKIAIAPNDMPSLSFCFTNIYGEDANVWVGLDDENGSSDQLRLNATTEIGNQQFNLEKIWTDTSQGARQNDMVLDCYKVSSVPLTDDKRLFEVDVIASSSNMTGGMACLTSEANAYGLGYMRWYDGKVDFLRLNGPFSISCSHTFVVTEVNEYHYDPSGCSEESYYECLGSRFAREDLTTHSIWCNIAHLFCVEESNIDKDYHGVGGNYGYISKCTFEKKCSSISMPKHLGLPRCSTDLETLCAEHVLNILRQDHQEHCKKHCSVKEYSVRDEGVDTQHCDDVGEYQNYFSMRYRFGLPDATKELRSDRPFKTVHTEYFILDGRGLVGNIGGTLGLFTGLSFFGLATWAYTVLKRMKSVTSFCIGKMKHRVNASRTVSTSSDSTNTNQFSV